MRRLTLLACALLLSLGALAPAARADFGVESFDVSIAGSKGTFALQAGSHPFSLSTAVTLNSHLGESKGKPVELADGDLRDLFATQMPGLAGNPDAVPTCPEDLFGGGEGHACPAATQLGIAESTIGTNEEGTPSTFFSDPVVNLKAPHGVAQRIGFYAAHGIVPVVIDLRLSPAPPYNVIASVTSISNIITLLSSKVTLWGVPADPAHDAERSCLKSEIVSGKCPSGGTPVPYLTLPRACGGPLATTYAADSWQQPGAILAGGGPDLSDPAWVTGSALTHDEAIPPNPQGFIGCDRLRFQPSIAAQPTSRAATSPAGLDFALNLTDEGIASAKEGATAASDVEKVVVTLPQGMTVNPSQAEGLEVCSEADVARETADSAPGQGCPEASKIGTIEVETPLLKDTILKGSLYVAEPYQNPEHSLIALYVVIKDPELGILVTQPLRVEPDPQTGQLITYSEDMPQLPFSHFRLHFREGGRAPLITPPGCGDFDVKALLYPWSGNPPVESTSTFQVISGPNNSPCPGGAAPFGPGFEAGTENNAAGRYSPFDMRLTRGDGEQDMTKFSATLPPGVLGKIAGIPYCPEAGIAQALSRTGEHGGTAELNDPSCKAASQIGRTVAGAGVGSQLTYVAGKLYLAGPYHGDPLSVVSITPAVAGPFDAGTVVVRVALTLNPLTAAVEADGSASDPIPHILQGIPLNVRDLRVYADRPDFTLNATSCEEEQARATLFGGGTLLAPLPDHPVGLAARYQAAGCASLGFKPRLGIKLNGGTRRGGHPALTAVVTPRAGDANFAQAVVTLPHSAFLDQAHIRTICTRVQFAAGAGHGSECPDGARYGSAKAWSPLLDEPLSGPVFLRSSNHNLPDLVIALHGLVDIELAARIDSIHGGIRSTFTDIPDAPVSRFILSMQGAEKGLIINSRNLCFKPRRNKADASLTGQNGKLSHTRLVVAAVKCGAARKHKRHRR